MIILQDIAKKISLMEQMIEERQVHEQHSNSLPSNDGLSKKKSKVQSEASNKLSEEAKSGSVVQKDSSSINQNMIINNSYVENSVKDIQSQVSNHKEEISSINQILSDEIRKL